MSTQPKETIRERIARQMAEEDAKTELRKAENQKKLEEADDKTVEKYKKLVGKANKKAEQYADAVKKVATIKADYDEVVSEVLRYQADVVEIGRDNELMHVDSIYSEDENASMPETEG